MLLNSFGFPGFSAAVSYIAGQIAALSAGTPRGSFGVMTGSVLTDWSVSVSPRKPTSRRLRLAANAGGASRCGAVTCAEQSLGGGSRLPAHLVRPILPMIAVLICTMLIIAYDKGLSMWLPRLLGLDR
jgi:hypothetical protein